MREIINEYSEAVIGSIGAISVFATLGWLVFSKGGLIVQLISLWGNGGC